MASNFKCCRCLKEFKYECHLQRHYSRKHPCKEPIKKIEEATDVLEKKVLELDTDLKVTKDELEETNARLDHLSSEINGDSVYKCQFCNQSFSFYTSYLKHKNKGRCKAKINNISIYERDLDIKTPLEEKLKCRFCDQIYKNQSGLSKHKTKGCRARDEYEIELKNRVIERRKEASAQIIHNNTHNGNNIIINMPKIEMNPFGQENLDYITTKLLIKELENCKAIQQADVSGIVDRFTKLIHANPAHPENQNVLFKSLNTGFARVYRPNGFQDEQSTEVQDTIIQNVQKLIQTKGCDEYDYNSKTEFADVLDDIDVNYGKINESLEDGMNTRTLGKCRNTVKAALHSNKEEITSSQNLIQ